MFLIEKPLITCPFCSHEFSQIIPGDVVWFSVDPKNSSYLDTMANLKLRTALEKGSVLKTSRLKNSRFWISRRSWPFSFGGNKTAFSHDVILASIHFIGWQKGNVFQRVNRDNQTNVNFLFFNKRLLASSLLSSSTGCTG